MSTVVTHKIVIDEESENEGSALLKRRLKVKYYRVLGSILHELKLLEFFFNIEAQALIFGDGNQTAKWYFLKKCKMVFSEYKRRVYVRKNPVRTVHLAWRLNFRHLSLSRLV